jgi:2'-hydroxyisoflavone reductase
MTRWPIAARGSNVRSMRILLLGGTSFVGRAIAQDALDRGAEVTLFGRGLTGRELFPGVERRIGDRDTGDYAALATGSWDAVVDVSAYTPRHVGPAMDVLGDRVGRYLFISSHAVYVREGVGPGSDEDTPRRPAIRDAQELTEETYGPSKAACEDDVLARYGSRATIVRPGKVAGPHDGSDMFAYWVRRAARGGRVAVPGRPEQPSQVVDVRDLARLVLRLVEDGRPGAFTAVGPAEPTTLGGLIETCARVAGAEVELVPIPIDAVPPLFPLVRPEAMWSTLQRSAARARAAGMPATPLATTAADVLAWDRERGLPPLKVGLSAAEEEKLLEEYA